MTERVNLPHAVLEERDHEIIVEIPLSFTKIQEQEQLSELAKPDPSFLSCSRQEIHDEQIYFFYDLPKGYKPLLSWEKADIKTKRKIAKNIIKINHIQGTQFTTYIHPNNIYCNIEGNIKFVYRGIRSVLPPEQAEGKEFVFQIKCLLLSFFTGSPFVELINKTLTNIPIDHPFIEDLGKAKSLSEIEAVLAKDVAGQGSKQGRKQNKQLENKSSVQSHYKQDEKPSTISTGIKRKENTSSKWLIPAICLVIGLLIGGIATYLIQVKPHLSALATSNDDMVELQNELEEVMKEKESQEEILSGYKLIVAGEREEAIELFSGMEQLSAEEEKILANQYVQQNTPESLSNAAKIDHDLHPLIAEKLLLLNSKEANEVLISLESNSPQILIEQAWLNKDYDKAISIYLDQLPDVTRAKTLAANSYFHLGNLKEANKLAKEMNDTSLQIKILTKEIDEIEKNSKKSNTEKEEEIKKKKEAIEKLKK